MTAFMYAVSRTHNANRFSQSITVDSSMFKTDPEHQRFLTPDQRTPQHITYTYHEITIPKKSKGPNKYPFCIAGQFFAFRQFFNWQLKHDYCAVFGGLSPNLPQFQRNFLQFRRNFPQFRRNFANKNLESIPAARSSVRLEPQRSN